MSATQGAEDRQVMPRWRSFGNTVKAGELGAPRRRDTQASESATTLQEASSAFRTHPGLYTAGDLLSQALTRGLTNESVTAAARFVLVNDSPAPVLSIAERMLYSDRRTTAPDEYDEGPTIDRGQMISRVRRMRRIVTLEPRNAIRWVDLALAHLNLGATDKATAELSIALELAPDSRYVLRSAARLFVLVDQPDRAQQALLCSARTLEDPWLMATELAVAETIGRTSKNAKRARSFLDRSGMSPRELSELSSALATIDLRSGHIRRARQLMRRALIDPTENTVAQAEWAAPRGLDRPDESALDLPLSYEARARFHAQSGNFAEAVPQSLAWQADEPFAPEPAVFASYVASVGTEQYQIAADAARQGLIASPGDMMLRNNLVFSLASAGDIEAAERELKILSADDAASSHATIVATQGLVAFRSGRLDDGRRLYKAAVDQFARERQEGRSALAAAFWAREEFEARTSLAISAFATAARLNSRAQSPDADLWLDRISARFRSP